MSRQSPRKSTLAAMTRCGGIAKDAKGTLRRRIKKHAVSAVDAKMTIGVPAKRGLSGELLRVCVQLVEVAGLEFRRASGA